MSCSLYVITLKIEYKKKKIFSTTYIVRMLKIQWSKSDLI